VTVLGLAGREKLPWVVCGDLFSQEANSIDGWIAHGIERFRFFSFRSVSPAKLVIAWE
jgi:hypothetical protein